MKYFRSVTLHNSINSPHVHSFTNKGPRIAFQNVASKIRQNPSTKFTPKVQLQKQVRGKQQVYLPQKTPREQKFKRQKRFGLLLLLTCQHPRSYTLVNKPSPIPSEKGSL